VTCAIAGLDWLSVVRVEKHDERDGRIFVISDNDLVKHPFSELSRYSVHYQYFDDIGVVTIDYQGMSGSF